MAEIRDQYYSKHELERSLHAVVAGFVWEDSGIGALRCSLSSPRLDLYVLSTSGTYINVESLPVPILWDTQMSSSYIIISKQSMHAPQLVE